MKTSGICNAQSARKHRKQGHTVQPTFGGRFMWFHPDCLSIVRNGTFGKLGGKSRLIADLLKTKELQGGQVASHIIKVAEGPGVAVGIEAFGGVIADEGNRFLTIDEMRAAEDVPPKPIAKLPQGAQFLVEGVGTVTMFVGESYWPKRRNQHSKPLRIVGFVEDAGVAYERGGDIGTMNAADFYRHIGKRVES